MTDQPSSSTDRLQKESRTSNIKFEFNWKLTVFSLILVPFMANLGFWQIHRAEEKHSIQQQWQDQQALAPIVISELTQEYTDYVNYQRVRLTGEFKPQKYWLQENQVRNGQLGYQVIMPFELANGQWLAVDRGWVAGSPLRDFVPEVATPANQVQISGTLITPSDSKLVREAEVSAKSWPHKILEVDLKVLSKQAKLHLVPKLLKLDADSAAALEVQWRPINMSAAKHYAYAVQWFLMALVLLILYFYASIKKKSDNIQR